MSTETTVRAHLTPTGIVEIEQPDGTYRPSASKTDWDKVKALTDAQVEAAARSDPDAPLLDDAFWEAAQAIAPVRIAKRHQGLRLDAEVIDWFKAQGPGWQTRMNAVLKAYVSAEKRRNTPG